MKTIKNTYLAALAVLLSPIMAIADVVVIQTSGTNQSSGHTSSAQSLTTTLDVFDSFGFWLGANAAGNSFTFSVCTDLTCTGTLFSTNFAAAAGFNDIAIGLGIAAGSTVFARIDYNGFTGLGTQFGSDEYGGGSAYYSNSNFSSLDLRFRAQFSSATVPEPGTLALLGLGIAGIGFARRKKV